MKAKPNAILIIVALLAYWIGLCNASAFYDPGTQRWLNRDPLGDTGSLAYLLPSLNPDTESDDGGGLTSDQLLNGFTQINLNLFGAIGNNPVNLIDAEGYCSLAGGATPEGAEIIAEELGDGAETLAQAGARKEAEEAAAKKAEQEAAKEADNLAKQAKKLSDDELKKCWNDVHEVKDLIKTQFKKELKKIGTNNPDIAVDANGNMVLRNPTDPTKYVPTGLSPCSFAH